MGYENSGRRPQPTALKVLRGNPGKRRLNAAEPKPPDGVVTRPERLSAGAVIAWNELAPICLHMGTLTTADVTVFATMCELQSTFTMASAAKNDQSPIESASGIKLERETAVVLRPYYALFGLDPASRARLVVPNMVEQPESKWAGVLR